MSPRIWMGEGACPQRPLCLPKERQQSRALTRHHCAVQPPSIDKLAPVIAAAASEVR